MDLNIDNYSLQDLLTLFHLPPHFTSEDLKEARKRVVAVHPDKSGLDKSYFLFFHKAYHLLTTVHSFKQKAQANMTEPQSFQTILESMEDTDKRMLIQTFTSNKAFNQEFNRLFDSLYVKEENGYGDWLKSNDDLDISYQDRKKQSRALIISDIDAANTPHYSDLKSVYTTDTVIGVSEEDYRGTYKTVEELKSVRAQNIAPLSREEAQKVFIRKEEQESKEATDLAFRLLQEEQLNQKHQQTFWSKLLRLQLNE
jgi:hypothetical protein